MSALDGKALLEYGAIIARRYAGRVGAEAAEELRAEAILRALRSPAPDGRVEPWLERIYKNLLIDRWRRHDPVTLGSDALDAKAARSDSPTPEDRLLARERRRWVRASLRQLPREARQVLLARYYAELDDESTASRFGIAAATVRTRVHRALARLRSRLADVRAWLPVLPASLGRAAVQISAVAAAPVLVAVLVIGAIPAPQARLIETPLSIPFSATSSFAPTQIRPVVPVVATAPVRSTIAKKHAAPAAVAPTTDMAPAAATRVLWPEALDVFGEPEQQSFPSLVEPPATLALQIVTMVDEL